MPYLVPYLLVRWPPRFRAAVIISGAIYVPLSELPLGHETVVRVLDKDPNDTFLKEDLYDRD